MVVIWFVLFLSFSCIAFLCLFGDPDRGTFSPFLLFFLALVAVGPSLQVVAAACFCFVCFFSCPPCSVCCGACVFRRPLLLPLRCVALLSAPSRWVVRGGSCLFFCVLLKRVCGRPRAGCLVCMRLSSLVCRPCLLFL